MCSGTRGKTALLNSVRKRASQLHKTVEVYQFQFHQFKTLNPTRNHPPSIEYLDLFKMGPDEPFWNDALFTNNHEPWAVDPDTQHGMRQISYLDQAQEEMRRIGWEVRRAMRWAVELHVSLHEAVTAQSDKLKNLASHPKLDSLTEPTRLKAAMVVIHVRWITITRLQERWSQDFPNIFLHTKPQANDSELLERWSRQVQDIKIWRESGKLSSIPGHFTNDPIDDLVDDDDVQCTSEGKAEFVGDDDDDENDDDADAEIQ